MLQQTPNYDHIKWRLHRAIFFHLQNNFLIHEKNSFVLCTIRSSRQNKIICLKYIDHSMVCFFFWNTQFFLKMYYSIEIFCWKSLEQATKVNCWKYQNVNTPRRICVSNICVTNNGKRVPKQKAWEQFFKRPMAFELLDHPNEQKLHDYTYILETTCQEIILVI